jgi:5-methylcytosine-specific restriction endonuclease McrA
MTIICAKCKIAQDSSEFYKNGRGFWTRECKTCKAKRFRKWRVDNQAHVRAQGRKHAAASRARHHDELLIKRREYYAKNAEKLREAARLYYLRFPEKCRESVKKSYLKNPEARRAYSKQWKLKHLERANENHRRWVSNNSNKKKQWHRRWYEKHSIHVQEINKIWQKQNPEKAKLIRAGIKGRRRARIKANGFERFSLKEILNRDGYRCHICTKRVLPKDLSFDHLIPISKGGPHTRQNVAVAHLSCNKKRAAGLIPAQLRLM